MEAEVVLALALALVLALAPASRKCRRDSPREAEPGQGRVVQRYRMGSPVPAR